MTAVGATVLGADAPRLLDASTAHRVAEGWAYGFAELAPGQSRAIAAAAEADGRSAPYYPWTAPLPAVVELDQLDATADSGGMPAFWPPSLKTTMPDTGVPRSS